MSLEEYKGVFVFAQQVDNVLDGVAFELLGKGKDLAKDLNTDFTADVGLGRSALSCLGRGNS
jgi:electron transfer flavoprotein alpha subunit